MTAGFSLPAIAASHSPQIWFTATAGVDISPLYAPNAPWTHAAPHVQVIKLYAVQIAKMADSELTNVIQFMDHHHIALAVEFGPLNATGQCGPFEGFDGARSATKVAQRIKQLGGNVAYVAMDEPYWFAHIYSGARQCHWSAQQIADNAKSTVNAFERVFPNIAIGDIEPISTIDTDDLVQQYRNWATVWHRTTGEKLAFFDADVQWNTQAVAILQRFSAMLKSERIPFGIIYNGNSGDPSNAIWLQHAIHRFEQFENGSNPLPDQAIFQSWHPNPTRLLPDNDPDAFTHIILSYMRKRTQLSDIKTGPMIRGRLLTQDGQPIALAMVDLRVRATSGSYNQSFTGIVPAKAAKMVIGWRVNTECGCDGIADLAVGHGAFHEDGMATVPVDLSALHLPARDTQRPAITSNSTVTLIKASPGERLNVNGPAVVVNAGKPFSFSLPFTIAGPTTASVNCNVIFLNATGKEVSRMTIALTPPWTVIGRASTDVKGTFTIAHPVATASQTELELDFPGDTSNRGATATVH